MMIKNFFKPHFVFIAILPVLLLIGFTMYACTNVNSFPKISSTPEYPNTIAENAKISDEYKDRAEKMSKDAVDEFLSHITKVPRGSENCDAIYDYLINWGNSNNFKVYKDSSGCVYMDVPASSGLENYPKIILQAHVDMVAVSSDPSIDMKTTPIDTIYDKEKGLIYSKDKKTTIGADDGEGIITLMEIATAKDVSHGPLRLLFTFDEETTMVGAQSVSPEVIDSDYLINVDASQVGHVYVSCSGAIKTELSKNYNTENIKQNVFDVKINNLIGGHSGADITKNRANALALTREIIKALVEKNIEFNLVSINGGKMVNAIATDSKLKIAFSGENKDKVKETIEQCFKDFKQNYKEDENANYVIEDLGEQNVSSISFNDSKEILDVLSAIPQGVVKMNDEYEGVPLTSSNIGTITLDNGRVEISSSMRSSDEDALKNMDQKLSQIGKEKSYEYKIDFGFPAWPKNADTSFTDLILKAYKEVCGFEGTDIVTHGGLECSMFLQKNANLKMISIGADVDNEHSVTETFYTKSLPAHFASCMYVLEHINTLAK